MSRHIYVKSVIQVFACNYGYDSPETFPPYLLYLWADSYRWVVQECSIAFKRSVKSGKAGEIKLRDEITWLASGSKGPCTIITCRRSNVVGRFVMALTFHTNSPSVRDQRARSENNWMVCTIRIGWIWSWEAWTGSFRYIAKGNVRDHARSCIQFRRDS